MNRFYLEEEQSNRQIQMISGKIDVSIGKDIGLVFPETAWEEPIMLTVY